MPTYDPNKTYIASVFDGILVKLRRDLLEYPDISITIGISEGDPNGAIEGSPGDVRIDLVTPTIWQKLTGDLTTTGWSDIAAGGFGPAIAALQAAVAILQAEPYVVWQAPVALVNGRILTAGTNVTIDLTTPGQVIVNASGGGGAVTLQAALDGQNTLGVPTTQAYSTTIQIGDTFFWDFQSQAGSARVTIAGDGSPTAFAVTGGSDAGGAGQTIIEIGGTATVAGQAGGSIAITGGAGLTTGAGGDLNFLPGSSPAGRPGLEISLGAIARNAPLAVALPAGVTNDLSTAGLHSSNVLLVTPTAPGSTLTGIEFLSGQDGRILQIQNVSTTTSLTLANDDAGSAAANRFLLPLGTSLAIAPGGAAEIWYDASSSRWRTSTDVGVVVTAVTLQAALDGQNALGVPTTQAYSTTIQIGDTFAWDLQSQTGAARVSIAGDGSATAFAVTGGITGAGAGQGISLVAGAATTAAQAGGAVVVTGGLGNTTGLGGALVLLGGQGGLTANGGAASMTGGPGGATAGAGGDSELFGGTPTDGNGGAARITGADAATTTATNRNGGAAAVLGGNAALGGTGGSVLITAGGGGTTGTANAVTITGGAGGSISGNGGSVTVRGGLPIDGNGGGVAITGRDAATTTATNRNGGAGSLSGGNAALGGTGGAVTVTAGGGGTTGVANAVTITGGAGGSTSGNGGNATVQGGLPTDGNGGGVTIAGRTGATTTATNRNGGGITIVGGAAVLGGSGGNCTFTGGTTISGAGGSVTVSGGSGGTSGTAGLAQLLGGAGSLTGSGATAQVVGGAGGATSGTGGLARLRGGATTDGTGGSVEVTGQNAATTTATNRNGGAVTIVSGDAVLAGAGGAIAVTGGNAGATGTAATVTITGGAGGSTSGAGGATTVQGGNATASGAAGGAVTIRGGAGLDAGAGGAATIQGRDGNGTNAPGGATNVFGGSSTGSAAAGALSIAGGNGGTTGTAGTVIISGGGGGSTSGNGATATIRGGLPTDGNGGGVNVIGRDGATTTAASRDGGAATIVAGNAVVAGTGGAISVTAGSGGATGSAGSVTITGGAGGSTSGAGGSATLRGGTPIDGTGGAVSITAANGVGTNRAGGTVGVTSGNGVGSGAGGTMTIAGGNGGATGTGANVVVTAGSGGTTGNAGSVTITGGAGGATSGNAGSATLRGGTPVDGTGGAVSIAAGNGVGTNRAGGTAGVTSGAGVGSGAGGALTVTAGAGGATGNGASIVVTAGAGGGTSGAGGFVDLTAGSSAAASTPGMVRTTTATAWTGTISPAALAAGATNDYAPTSGETANTMRWTPNAAGSTITGLTSGRAGRRIKIFNISSTASITITTDTSGASTAANRFLLPNSQSIVIPPLGSIEIWYDGTSSRWRLSPAAFVSATFQGTFTTVGAAVTTIPLASLPTAGSYVMIRSLAVAAIFTAGTTAGSIGQINYCGAAQAQNSTADGVVVLYGPPPWGPPPVPALNSTGYQPPLTYGTPGGVTTALQITGTQLELSATGIVGFTITYQYVGEIYVFGGAARLHP